MFEQFFCSRQLAAPLVSLCKHWGLEWSRSYCKFAAIGCLLSLRKHLKQLPILVNLCKPLGIVPTIQKSLSTFPEVFGDMEGGDGGVQGITADDIIPGWAILEMQDKKSDNAYLNSHTSLIKINCLAMVAELWCEKNLEFCESFYFVFSNFSCFQGRWDQISCVLVQKFPVQKFQMYLQQRMSDEKTLWSTIVFMRCGILASGIGAVTVCCCVCIQYNGWMHSFLASHMWHGELNF